MRKIKYFVSVFFAVGTVYAQQPEGQGQYTRENFPTATSSAAKVINLDMKENITNTLGEDDEVEVLKNVVYVDRNGTNLHVHILFPKGTVSQLPCIVYVPGSAWMKQNIDMGIPNMTRLAAKGFVVAIVEYRPSVVGKFPSQVQDAKTAIRFMRKNAGQYHKASPIYYATAQAAPVFMAHGDRDMMVPLNQSDLVAEALDKVGIHYEYYCLLGAGHGGREFWSNEMLIKALAFLKKYSVKTN